MVGLPCSGPVNRREFLRYGSVALGGLTMADVLARRAAAGTTSADTSVILLYLHGGPSQLETYDLKPQAPSTYRSIFNPIPTVVPGMEICDLFPRQAKIADKFSLVRSLTHDIPIHSDGGIIVLTGHRPSKLDPTSGSKSEHPDFGSVASRIRGTGATAIPQYVAIPSKPYMTQPTYLGMHHSAFELGNVSQPGYTPPHAKLVDGGKGAKFDDRRALVKQLDQLRGNLDLVENMQGTDEFRQRAFELLSSPEAIRAFDLSCEKDTLRDRYGRHLWGQGCLMARRLAEAGSAVISIFIDTPMPGKEFTNWDDHVLNAGQPGHFAEYMQRRLPYLDQALTTLIEDIYERSLDRKILVVVVGEFGRTPRLSSNVNGTGRDHWPTAYTALVSGGGLKMGQVVGATSSKSEYPAERPYSPQDLLATVYRHLAIDTRRTHPDYSGRPIFVLDSGEPIAELI